MKGSKLVLVLILAAVVASFFALDLGRYVTLDFFRAQQDAIESFQAERPGITMASYAAIYIVVTALSLPGAAIMTLIGGALFGLVRGTVIVSFASTIGATLAFLVARFLLRDSVQRRFGRSLRAVNEGVRRDGPLYLFMLRLVPVFPFFVINLVMALTPMKAVTFYLVSQVGMLPGTIVYVNAGTQLARIDSAAGIVSPGVIGAFLLLGMFPLVARWMVRALQARRALRGWPRPSTYDRNLIVIGAGAAGLVTSYIAAAVKARVTLIEKGAMGGDCLNTGCVPSKALIRTSRFLSHVARHREYGVRAARADADFGEVMERVQRVIARIEPHDSVERYEELGVEVIKGSARITGPWSVEVDGRTLTARNLVVATGAEPAIPPLPGLSEMGYLTSETIWKLRTRPDRLLVLGGGAVGCELAQAFQRLGVHVTQVERLPHLLHREDPEVSRFVEDKLGREGVSLRTGLEITAFEVEEGGQKVALGHRGEERLRIPFDELLVAVGRRARVDGFGLEEVGVRLDDEGRIDVNAQLQTHVPTIYACGDCVGPHLYTHAASHQAWFAAVNSLFANPFKRFKVNYDALPRVTFTDPEVARVGLNEREARRAEIEYDQTTFDLAGLDRAIVEEEAHGFVKVLTARGRDRILGATVVGDHAGELIAEFTLAIKHRIGLNGILGTIHAYPTFAEAGKLTAGRWKKANAPKRALRWVERYHRWRRG